MICASNPTAKAFALAISGAAVVVSFPNAAEAFTDRQCNVIQTAFSSYIRANAANFSNDDRAELRKFNAWVGSGCQGNIVLQRRPEVAAAMHVVQTRLSASPDPEFRIQLADQVTLSSVAPNAAAVPTAPNFIRPNGTAPQRAPGG